MHSQNVEKLKARILGITQAKAVPVLTFKPERRKVGDCRVQRSTLADAEATQVTSGHDLLRLFENLAVEPYITSKELAALLDVAPETVSRWKKDGCPHLPTGVQAPRYRLTEVIDWLRVRFSKER